MATFTFGRSVNPTTGKLNKNPVGKFDSRALATNKQGVQAAVQAIGKELGAKVYLPEDLLQGLGIGSRKGSTVITDRTRFSPAAIEQLNKVANAVPTLHYLYYQGLLRAMDDLLKSPGIPMVGDMDVDHIRIKRPVALRTPGFGSQFKAATRTLQLQGRWKTLRPFTIKEKKEFSRLGYQSRQFWRHTGTLSSIYHRHMLRQLRSITLSSFIGQSQTYTKDSVLLDTGGSDLFKRARTSQKGKYARVVGIQFQVGIPVWDDVMDAIITKPLGDGKVPDITALARANREPAFLGRAKALKLSQKETEKGLRKIQKENDTTIKRALNPEYYRPWLRQLSSEAHNSLFADIKKLGAK